MTDSAPDDDSKFDQVVHEYYQAIESGQSVEPEAFILKHAEHESQLRSFFADLNAIGGLPGLSAMERTVDQNAARRNLVLFPILASGNQVTYIGQYRLLEEIARGGMGVVFKARQEKLARIVALKMILSGPLASSTEIDRFRREARAAARLQHPNIVSVHEIGQHEEHYFFTMDYVESDSLADRLREGSLSAQESALLTLKISRAMSYAHQEGVLHRDLKPANILIDPSGEPHITDFGLAKAQADADIDTLSNMTESGQILGTPSYMSPEQASGKTDLVSVQSDVYSIGAILYACLVGRAPFVGESSIHTIRQVIESDPASPRSINSSVPLDIETICLKCLEKEPCRRYSLIELIEDIERFLAGRPIRAKAVGLAGRFRKWCKRNPSIAALSASLLFAMGGGLAFSSYYWLQSEVALAGKSKAVIDGRQNLYESCLREAEALQTARKPGYTEVAWNRLRAASELEGISIDYERIRRLAESCLGDFVGLTPITISDVGRNLGYACTYLDEETLAVALEDQGVTVRSIANGKELSRIYRYGNVAGIQAMASVDGDLLVGDLHGIERWTQPRQGKWTRVWSAPGKFYTFGNILCIFSDQRRLALFNNQTISILDTSTGSVLQTIPAIAGTNPTWIAATSDGSLIAAADPMKTEFAVWRTKDAKLLARREVKSDIPIKGLQFGLDDRFLFVACDEGTFQYSTRDFSQWSVVHSDRVATLSLAPNAKQLLVPLVSGAVHLRELSSQRTIANLDQHRAIGDQAYAAFSPSGNRAAILGGRLIQIWNLAAASERLTVAGHDGATNTCEFHPSLPILATGSTDGTVTFWNTETGTRAGGIDDLDGAVHSVSYHPSGNFLAIGVEKPNKEAVVQIFDAAELDSPQQELSVDFPKGINQVAFSDGGNQLAATGGCTKLWAVSLDSASNSLSLSEQRLEQGDSIWGHHVNFRSNTQTLAVTPQIQCWTLEPSRLGESIWKRGNRVFVSNCEWLDSSSQVVGITEDGIEIWDTASQSRVRTIGRDSPLSSMLCRYSPVTRLLATVDGEKRLTIIDLQNGKLLHRLGSNPLSITAMQWDSTGSQLALGLAGGGVHIWKLSVVQEKLKAAGMYSHSVEQQGPTPNVGSSQAITINQQSWDERPADLEDEVRQLFLSLGLETDKLNKADAIDDRLADRFAALGGAIDSRSAFVTSASRKDFEECVQLLAEMQFGICSLRTHNSDGEIKYAACWRAKLFTELQHGLTKSDLRKSIESMQQKGYHLIDMGGYLAGNNTEKFWGIWSTNSESTSSQVIRLGLNQQAISKSFEDLKTSHMPLSRQAYFDSERQIRYCEIWEPKAQENARFVLFSLTPETMRSKLHKFQHLACQSIDLAQGKNPYTRFSSVVWHTPQDGVEMKAIHGVPQDVLVESGKRLMRLGFQPKCISVSTGDRLKQQCASLWTRQTESK